MTKLTLSAPASGLNKVRLSKALQSVLGLSLSEAKRVTDQVADGQAVSLSAADHAVAERMACSARDVGAAAVVEDAPVAARPLAG